MNEPEACCSPEIKRRSVRAILLSVYALGLALAGCRSSESRQIADLKDANPAVRRNAAEALGKRGDPHSVVPLIAALNDADAEVRFAAAGALAKLDDRDAIGPLIATLKDTDSNVRWSAAFALRDIGIPAVSPLIAVLEDTDPTVRAIAARILGEIKNPLTEGVDRPGLGIAVDPLIAALEDSDSEVRSIAAHALAEIGAPAAERLIPALRAGDLAVVARAHSFFIEWAEPGSEDPLIQALNAHGTTEMAEEYLNCGNSALREAAQKWAAVHGHSTVSLPRSGRGGAGWGARR
ncbi:MAG: HEAT repeat domain-containing protein [Candidatus Aminicenantes bacterium]|nr:HEAT repeat domain-containing protein [Candidatus Aminicenantes bacterium]